MTGEITLTRQGAAGRRHQGEGARRLPRRRRTIILPRANADALEDVPDEVRTRLRFEWVDAAEALLRVALPDRRAPIEATAPAPLPH